MEIEHVKEIVRRKPTFFIIASVVYLIVVAFLKWSIHPSIDTLLFVLGGIVGIFFLDVAEVFFHLNPSPFRGMVFFGAFTGVCFFILTSSGSFLASGLVLSLYVTMMLWQAGEWRLSGNLDSWYTMIAVPVSRTTQQRVLIGVYVLFFVLTVLFVR